MKKKNSERYFSLCVSALVKGKLKIKYFKINEFFFLQNTLKMVESLLFYGSWSRSKTDRLRYTGDYKVLGYPRIVYTLSALDPCRWDFYLKISTHTLALPKVEDGLERVLCVGTHQDSSCSLTHNKQSLQGGGTMKK